MNIHVSLRNVESFSWHLSGRNTLSTIQNSFSTAEDDAEIVSYFNASSLGVNIYICFPVLIEEDHYYGLYYCGLTPVGTGVMTQCWLIAGKSSTMLAHN